MADETPTNPELADEVHTGPLVGESAEDSGPIISAFNEGDDELLAELLEGNEDEQPADPVAQKPAAEADAPTPDAGDHTEADARGIEILIAERGFTAAQAKRMAEKDPEMVREIGAAALEAEGKGDPDPDKDDTGEPGEIPEKPEAKPGPDDEPDGGEVEDKVLEVLGRTFDRAEAKAVADAIALVTGKGARLPDVAALVEKQVAGKLESITKTLTAYDAALSNLMARGEAARLAEFHPEIKTEEGYAKVYAKAQALSKTGRFNSIGDLMDAAATIVYGPKRQAEIKGYKEKVSRYRNDGVAENPGSRAPAGVTMDRDDLVLEMALDGKTDNEIKEELARASRR